MREIKYKAFDKVMKTTHEVLELDLSGQRACVLYGGVFHNWVDFRDIELMQFTGLRDKNGVEIYEGDVVALYGMFDEGAGAYHNATVTFQDGSFTIDDPFEYGVNRIPIAQWLEDGGEYVNVIGNVYENPDLLEVSNG